MKFIIEDEIVEEISPIKQSDDRAIVLTPEVGKRGEGISDIQKEIIAIDSLIIGPTKAAEINGGTVSSASRYGDGKDVANEDVKARIQARKYDIQDTAVVKLMNTLNMIEPTELRRTKDKVMVMNSLTNVITKFGDTKDNSGPTAVILQLHMPTQKKENDYKVIDV